MANSTQFILAIMPPQLSQSSVAAKPTVIENKAVEPMKPVDMKSLVENSLPPKKGDPNLVPTGK